MTCGSIQKEIIRLLGCRFGRKEPAFGGSAIGNVVNFLVGTPELDFILRFLAMAELKRASFCSFGLTKTFVDIALGFLASRW